MSGAATSPRLEAFFVAMALELGTSPVPLYGINRDRVAKTVVGWCVRACRTPATREFIWGFDEVHIHKKGHTWNCPIDIPMDEYDFYLSLADGYLDWLYAHAR